MADDERKVPDQKELEKELSDYLSKKYGAQVKIVSPMMLPKAAEQKAEGETTGSEAVSNIQFDMKPEELEAYLNEYVIKQDEAKKVLSVALCDHYHHVQQALSGRETRNYTKQNIILLGPTGVGKTYLIRSIAELIGVPFVKADATKFSETGYVGGDAEDLVRDLVRRANGVK